MLLPLTSRWPRWILLGCLLLGAVRLAGPAGAEEVFVDVASLPTADGWTLGSRDPDQTPVYKTTPEGPLRLHVFLPPDEAVADRPRSALVLFHGGGWVQGSPKAFAMQANALAERGMVVICPEYRLGGTHGTTPFECVADAKSAIRYVRAQAATWNIDPQRIAAGGGSAGGHIATASAVLGNYEDPADKDPQVSSRPDALLLWNPVLDTSPAGFGHRRVGDDPERLSPLHQLDQMDGELPPTLIFNGDADKTATAETARAFTEKAKRLGGDCTLVIYSDQPHAFFYKGKNGGRCFLDSLARSERFLEQHGFLSAHVPAGEQP